MKENSIKVYNNGNWIKLSDTSIYQNGEWFKFKPHHKFYFEYEHEIVNRTLDIFRYESGSEGYSSGYVGSSTITPHSSKSSGNNQGDSCKLGEVLFRVMSKHRSAGYITSYDSKYVDANTPKQHYDYYLASWKSEHFGKHFYCKTDKDFGSHYCEAEAPDGLDLKAIEKSMKDIADQIYKQNLGADWKDGGLYVEGSTQGANGTFTIQGKGSYTIKNWSLTGCEANGSIGNPFQIYGAIKLENVDSNITSIDVDLEGMVFTMKVGDIIDSIALDTLFPFEDLPKPAITYCVSNNNEYDEKEKAKWPKLVCFTDKSTYPFGRVGIRKDLQIKIVGYSCKKSNESAKSTSSNAYSNALPEELK